NAAKFGFILRYPKGKENVTSITYEPWHYRYVGRVHAERMKRMELTLEEYLELQCAKCD
ncbi:MAG: D-alanyl-D-alanine carboxypeptidase family protein, partial [Oscillospiraceae bacterium]|nr:D-alanyl-D-alanine carboxypeptidase family protein [Oscillospiraceae bacterium]